MFFFQTIIPKDVYKDSNVLSGIGQKSQYKIQNFVVYGLYRTFPSLHYYVNLVAHYAELGSRK